MPKLILENIDKIYQNDFHAVKNVNLDISDGEFMVLVGPSGCGKSTVLRMIAGLEDISSGKLIYDGIIWNDLEPKKRNIGMVFQNYALYPHLTVAENLAFPLSVAKMPKKEIMQKVNETADIIGLNELLDRKPKQLSGGQRQRVALGRAIIRKPKLFLFDEPLSNLDAKLRVQMRNEIQKLHQKFSVASVYVTHDQVEAMTMGTRLAVMNAGEIMQVDTPERIYSDPDNLFVAGFIGSPEMNSFKGDIESNSLAESGSSLRFAISSANIKNATIGIRPESFAIKQTDAKPNKISVKVLSSEYLGHETIIYFKTAESLKRVRVFDKMTKKNNANLDLYYNSNDLLLFGADGKRIRNNN